MLKRRHSKEVKSHVVALKLNGSLVEAIDREAEAEGLSRSAIIRRVLKRQYAEVSVAVHS